MEKIIINLLKEPEKAEETRKRYEELKKNKKIVMTSGYFDPLHHGHVELFKLSKQLGDYLIVVINNDIQTKMKKGYVFMPAEDKAKIIIEFACVDEVFISIDEDELIMNGVRHIPQCKTLEFMKPHIFAKGGDRYAYEIPETPVCRKNEIEIIDGIGAKVQSSSELVRKSKEIQDNKQ
jgi:cytidyltransferase-like protein